MSDHWQDFGFTSLNLSNTGLLPSDWIDEIREAALKWAARVYLDGNDKDCREPAGTNGCEYFVVPGDLIASELPWLCSLYEDSLARVISQVTGEQLVPARNRRAGININMLKGLGARYEWHVDPNPVTGILFATDHPRGRGGALVLDRGGEQIQIQPQKGLLFIFRGSDMPHSVLPLDEEKTRLSIPMIYYRAHEEQRFSAELENYLYGPLLTQQPSPDQLESN